MDPIDPPAFRQEQQQQQHRPAQPRLYLIDEEEWLNLNGLRQASEGEEEPNAGDRETTRRMALESSYQREIHAKIFADEDLDGQEDLVGNDGCRRSSRQQRRRSQLEEWKDKSIEIFTTKFEEEYTSGDQESKTEPLGAAPAFGDAIVVIRTNLKELAARSDTVFAMASNQHLFNNNNNHSSSDGDVICKNKDAMVANVDSSGVIKASGINKNCIETTYSLSLRDYSSESVKVFLEVLQSFPLQQQQQQHSSSNHGLPASTPIANNNASMNTSPVGDFTTKIAPVEIPPDFVIDCCRLAHYLQCQQVLDFIVDEYLMTSIDHENCRFLCKLADELSLPRLWEASVNCMLSSLQKFDHADQTTAGNVHGSGADANDHREACLWEDLSPALKTEIQALRGILRSSNRKKVYFSTYHEYLGLLAEQLQYYKERLADAKHSQRIRMEEQATLEEELKALQIRKNTNGWYRNTQLERQIENTHSRLEGLGRGRDYAAQKIERQEQRVATLGALWKEQKRVFGGGLDETDNASGDRCGRQFKRKR